MTVDRVDRCGSAGEEYGRDRNAGGLVVTVRNGARDICDRFNRRDTEVARRGAALLVAGPVSDIVNAQIMD